MSTVLQLVFSGMTIGAIYALVATGFTLIYRSSGIFNFAQGEFVVLGGMVTAAIYAVGVSYPLAALLAVAGTGLVGLCLYMVAIAPAKGAQPVQLLIITVGASVFIRGVISVTLGKDFIGLPNFMSEEVVHVGGAVIQTQAIIVVAGMVLIVAALRLFLSSTATGKAVRATASNSLAAFLVGINPGAIIAICFTISAVIGALGGVLATPITMTSYDAGTVLAVKGFAAAMLGGVGHPFGPVFGGILIGMLEAFGAGYLSSNYKDAFAFAILLGVLSFRPQGILGGLFTERV